MTSLSSAFQKTFRDDLPVPAAPWSGFDEFDFVGGHIAPESIPTKALIEAITRRLEAEGQTLATYKLESGPLGHRTLREWLSQKLARDAGIACTPDEILLTSGSLQGMDLINSAMLKRGDTVLIEADNYGGVFSRLKRQGIEAVRVAVDDDGMRMESLAETLSDLAARGIRPKYIYTIPTIQNPTATVLPESRRREMLALAAEYDVPIFEDDCYADLTWDDTRPRAVYALDNDARVVYLGSFSKSVAPALRVGYVVAPWPVLAQLLPLKTDAGSGAIEQMMLAEYCPTHFDAHVAEERINLKRKCDNLIDVLGEAFGTAAEFRQPKGGIFLWVRLPPEVDTGRLAKVAAAEGIAINSGPEWSIADDASRCIRICFAKPSLENMRDGIRKLADVCRATFGVPERSANVAHGSPS